MTLSSFIWSFADLLRGDYKQSDYGKVILPFTVLRRLDCVLDATKAKVLAELQAKQNAGLNPRPFPTTRLRPELLQHLSHGHGQADGRSGPYPRKLVRLRAGVLARR